MSNEQHDANSQAGEVRSSDQLGLGPARAMADAPLDGTLVQLLVRFDNHGVEDTNEPTWTIGSHNDGEWNFVGWCWHTDEWTRGSGDLLGWLPMGGAERGHVRIPTSAAEAKAMATVALAWLRERAPDELRPEFRA